MTKKDYELIAGVLKQEYYVWRQSGNTGEAWAILDCAISFSKKLAESNPRFDKAKFLVACGFEPESRAIAETK